MYSSVNENFAKFLSGIGSMKVDTGDATSFDLNSLSTSPIIPSLVDSLHLKEYGGWYVATAMAVTAAQQRSAGREEASKEFESELELARAKASEAASAAGLAAEGARMAKSLAMKMEGQTSGKDATQAMLEKSRMEKIQTEKVRAYLDSHICIMIFKFSYKNAYKLCAGFHGKRTQLSQITSGQP